MTSGPRQPQCLRSVNAPTPYTSLAGSDRVNVTHSQFASDRAAKSLSSTTTTNGKPSGTDNSADNFNIAGTYSASSRRSRAFGPRTVSTPGKPTRGSSKPSPSRRFVGTTASSLRRGGPATAITALDPAFSPNPAE